MVSTVLKSYSDQANWSHSNKHSAHRNQEFKQHLDKKYPRIDREKDKVSLTMDGCFKVNNYFSLNCCFSWSNSVSSCWINFVTSAWNSGWQPRNAALWRIGSFRVLRSVSISCKASIFAVKFIAECVSQKETMTPLGSWEAFVTEAVVLREPRQTTKGKKLFKRGLKMHLSQTTWTQQGFNHKKPE